MGVGGRVGSVGGAGYGNYFSGKYIFRCSILCIISLKFSHLIDRQIYNRLQRRNCMDVHWYGDNNCHFNNISTHLYRIREMPKETRVFYQCVK